MIEKREECPSCGEFKRWLYDAQICAACCHGDRYAANRKEKRRDDLLAPNRPGDPVRRKPACD
jgi:hypothetical protein